MYTSICIRKYTCISTYALSLPLLFDRRHLLEVDAESPKSQRAREMQKAAEKATAGCLMKVSSIHPSVSICFYLFLSVYVYLFLHIYLFMYICLRIYVHICLYMSYSIYIYIYIYIFDYMYCISFCLHI